MLVISVDLSKTILRGLTFIGNQDSRLIGYSFFRNSLIRCFSFSNK
jgi:hypothetical protein